MRVRRSGRLEASTSSAPPPAETTTTSSQRQARASKAQSSASTSTLADRGVAGAMDLNKFYSHYNNFQRPPFAQIYYPTAEEFSDPIQYVSSIRAQAEKYGVVKIVPPAGFRPPFAIDRDNFKFTPRVQRLNEIEAIVKEKETFHQRLATYCSMIGKDFERPYDKDGNLIDLHRLYRLVEFFGYYVVERDDLWKTIAKNMMTQGIKQPAGFAKQLREIYHSILESFVKNIKVDSKHNEDDSEDEEEEAKHRFQHHHGMRNAGKGSDDDDSDEDYEECTPTMQGRRRAGNGKSKSSKRPNGRMMAGLPRKENKKKKKEHHDVKLDTLVCKVCGDGGDEANLLMCEECEIGMHAQCCDPPLDSIPPGDWRCPPCVQEIDSKVGVNWGFHDNAEEYSLRTFEEYANNFKCNYFGVEDPTDASTEDVEAAFWRNVVADETVAVKYGADLITSQVGSGFPRKTDENKGIDAKHRLQYINHAWNLNNLPVLKESVLSHFDIDISGMMVPWVYVGMCFSTFCWHTEDHWTYSINYNHWGERKIWYGIGGDDAAKFEKAVRELAPGLTGRQRDLFHHMTTAANPSLLCSLGVPIYTVHQNPGEFVITFPRAYHAGFNEGINFAEAVNFAPIDWLCRGRLCVDEYAEVRRYCVFSHDELVLKMVSKFKSLEISMCLAALDELMEISKRETKNRKDVKSVGITKSKFVKFEQLSDDGRACRFCKTTMFLSAIECGHGHRACLPHYDRVCKLCTMSQCTLLYRYTIDEFKPMLENLETLATDYFEWKQDIADRMHDDEKLSLEEIEGLIDEGKRKKYAHTPQMMYLHQIRQGGRFILNKAAILLNGKVRTRVRTRIQRADTRLDVEGIREIVDEMRNMVCSLEPATTQLEELINNIESWEQKAQDAIENCSKNDSDDSIEEVEKLVNEGDDFDVKLPLLEDLRKAMELKQWKVRTAQLLEWKAVEDMEWAEDWDDAPKWTPKDVLGMTKFGDRLPGANSERNNINKLHEMMRNALAMDTEAGELLMKPSFVDLQRLWPAMRESMWCSAENLNEMREELAIIREAFRRVYGCDRPPEPATFLDLFDLPAKWEDLSELVFSLPDVLELCRICDSSKLLKHSPFSNSVISLRERYEGFTKYLRNLFKPSTSYYSLAEIIGERDDLAPLSSGAAIPRHLESNEDFENEWYKLSEFEKSRNLLEHENALQAQFRDLLGSLQRTNSHRSVNETCICAGGESDSDRNDDILCCVLCRAKYHVECYEWSQMLSQLPEGIFLCVRCLRGKRPLLDDVTFSTTFAPPKSVEVTLVKALIEKSRRISNEIITLDGELRKSAGQPVQLQIVQRLTSALQEWFACEVVHPNAKQVVFELAPTIFHDVIQPYSAAYKALQSRPLRALPLPLLFVHGNGIKTNKRGKRKLVTKVTCTRKDRKRSRSTPQKDDHEECPALRCFKPYGDPIEWIQCSFSSCQRWYHMVCVGQTVKQAEALDTYACHFCAKDSKSGDSSPQQTEVDVQSSAEILVVAPVS